MQSAVYLWGDIDIEWSAVPAEEKKLAVELLKAKCKNYSAIVWIASRSSLQSLIACITKDEAGKTISASRGTVIKRPMILRAELQHLIRCLPVILHLTCRIEGMSWLSNPCCRIQMSSLHNSINIILDTQHEYIYVTIFYKTPFDPPSLIALPYTSSNTFDSDTF